MKKALFLVLLLANLPSVKSFSGELESSFKGAQVLNTTTKLRGLVTFTRTKELDILAAMFVQLGSPLHLTASDISSVEYVNNNPFTDSTDNNSGDTFYFLVKQNLVCSFNIYDTSFECFDKTDASEPLYGRLFFVDTFGHLQPAPDACLVFRNQDGFLSRCEASTLTNIDGQFTKAGISMSNGKKSLKKTYETLSIQSEATSLLQQKATAAKRIKALFLQTLDVMSLEQIDPDKMEYRYYESSWKSYPEFFFQSQRFGFCKLDGLEDSIPEPGLIGKVECFDKQGTESLLGRYYISINGDAFYVKSSVPNAGTLIKGRSYEEKNGKFYPLSKPKY